MNLTHPLAEITRNRPLAHFIDEAGGVVGGGAVMGGLLGYAAGSVVLDLSRRVPWLAAHSPADPRFKWAEQGTYLGAATGLAAYLFNR